VPWVVYSLQNPFTFRSGDDIYSYLSDSNYILANGTLPQANDLIENNYYASFPVFTMLIFSINSVSGLSLLFTVHLLNILIQVLFWLLLWLTLNKNFTATSKIPYLFIGFIFAVYANPYLYGYFNSPLPQTLGLCALFLLFMVNTKNETPYAVLFMILLAFGLVHVSVIPLFLFVLSTLIFFNIVFAKQSIGIDKAKRFSPYMLMLPATVFLGYSFFTVAGYTITGYAQKIFLYMSDLATEALKGPVSVSEGLSRGVLYPLNALGPALVVGATLSFIAIYLMKLRNGEKTNNWLGAFAFAAIILIGLGALKGLFNVWGGAFGSISRYFNLPGYAFATIITVWVIANSFKIEQKNRVGTVLLIVLLILSAIGGLTDPLAF